MPLGCKIAQPTRGTYQSPSDHDGTTRRFVPCPRLTDVFGIDELVVKCEWCNRFFARCCIHYDPRLEPDEQIDSVCHHSPIVFTDGACSKNGHDDAKSGIGIVIGSNDDKKNQYQWAFPVDNTLDPVERRTNQRAELLAALQGLKMICNWDEQDLRDSRKNLKRGSPTAYIIITTDSEYVVKGMTEWVPAWKDRGWRRSDGRIPFNLDLFQKLEAEVEARERRHSCKVKFWYVERRYNHLADAMAKRGAK